jgi:single-strand DNA-binding protein
MTEGFSLVVLEGNLGQDPAIKATPSGKRVANFSVAVSRGFGDNKHTNWFNIVAWREQADFAEKYLKKGKSVRITGELDTRSWDDKQTGSKRTVTEIIADKIQFVDNRESQDRAPATRQASVPQTRIQTQVPARAEQPSSDDPFGEDVPF